MADPRLILAPEEPMADPDFSGRTMGDFLLLEKLAEGGFGAVYLAEQSPLTRAVVVKVLHERHQSDEALERFKREAQLASRLDHAYAAHVYAFGVADEDGLPWIAMELVHGITLEEWLRTRGPMTLEQLVPFFERVAEVLHDAHELGIIHRDVKPSNIMVIEREGRVDPKVLDFGIAKVTFPEDRTDGVLTTPVRAKPRRVPRTRRVQDVSGSLANGHALTPAMPYSAPRNTCHPSRRATPLPSVGRPTSIR